MLESRQQMTDSIVSWRLLSPHRKGWLTRWARPYLISGFNLFMQRVYLGHCGYGRPDGLLLLPPPAHPIVRALTRRRSLGDIRATSIVVKEILENECITT